MRCHIVLFMLYFLIGVWVALSIGYSKELFILIIPGVWVFLHALLAYGSYKGIEVSRKISVVVFMLVAIALMPIGTLIAVFVLLPSTQWEIPQGG